MEVLQDRGVAPRTDSRVLEFGFGHGHLLFWFKPPTGIYGVELSEQAIEAAHKRARKAGHTEFDFRLADPENSARVAYPADFFDLAMSSHTLEHMWDDRALLEEFFRVLKPGGRLLVIVPHDVRHAEVMSDVEARRNPNFPSSSYHVFNYNLETLVYLISSCGFAIDVAERFDAVMSWRRRWPRGLAMCLSAAMPAMPYSAFRSLDKLAVGRGYPCMQALVSGTKVGQVRP